MSRADKAPKLERTERLQILLPLDELAAIDQFRSEAQMPSRAAAVRELLRRGLALSKPSTREESN
jgi:metal-responsive CopG/Arc/MetJ family transcriptional regulator